MTRVQTFQNDSIEFKSFEIFNLKDADAQSANVQSLTSKNLNETAINVLFS